MVYETQLIKHLYHPDYVVQVKEEIIEVDVTRMEMKKYIVIIEKARRSFWNNVEIKN